MIKRSKYTLLTSYVAREYIFSFFVSFLFFFFIFFVNQILVFAQKIVLKNVGITDMLRLVVLFIPQFLMYTMPFSSLASAGMVIGNFSSYNEILAIRSCGISTKRIFLPIIVISVFFSIATYFIADYLIPSTAQKYRELYGEMLEKMPTIELTSYSSTRFGDRVISNGVVEGNTLNNVLIFDDTDQSDSRVVWAESAQINLLDLEKLIYSIDLYNPKIIITDLNSQTSYSVAQAEKITLYLKLSATGSGYNPITPSQMSLKELSEEIESYVLEDEEVKTERNRIINKALSDISSSLKKLEAGESITNSDLLSLGRALNRYDNAIKSQSFSFYYQYYRAEYQKKIALSVACTVLIFVAFPLSFSHMKYGRLTGLGLSIIVASLYWFGLYFLHTRAILAPENPAFYLWLPNAVILIAGILLLWRHAKQ